MSDAGTIEIRFHYAEEMFLNINPGVNAVPMFIDTKKTLWENLRESLHALVLQSR